MEESREMEEKSVADQKERRNEEWKEKRENEKEREFGPSVERVVSGQAPAEPLERSGLS
jgi:hypothetical protein